MKRTARKPGAIKLKSSLTRRHLLKVGAITAATLIPGVALADEWVQIVPRSAHSGLIRTRFIAPRRSLAPSTATVRSLSMYNVHTDEKLNVVYYENGEYIPGAVGEVNHFFRDFRANEIKPIDPNLLDVLFDVHSQLDTSKPYNLVSGYRSPATNALLASMSEGVARHSMHIEGRAADVNLPGRELSFLERIALALRLGGVGYYPRSGFVHIDTGRVRRW